MMKISRLLFTLVFLLINTGVFAEPKTETPKPVEQPQVENLKPGWWNYFSQADEHLREHIDVFEKSLIPLQESASKENRKLVRSLIEKIKINLNSYAQSASLDLPKIPLPKTIAPSYSIEELLDLYRRQRNLETEISAGNGELQEKTKQLKSLEERYRMIKDRYEAAEPRSQENLLTGLETVAYRSNIEVIQKNIAFIRKSIESKQTLLKYVKEEIQSALNTLTTSDLELYLLAQKVKVKEDEWEQTQEQLKKIEAQEQAMSSEAIVDKQDTRYQLLSLETDQAEIQETIAENEFILATVELALAQLINSPESLELEKLRTRARSASSIIEQVIPKLNEWTGLSERQIEKAGQYLAGEGKKDLSEVLEVPKEQKKILSVAQQNLLLVQKLRNEVQETQFLLQELKKQIALAGGGGERWLQQAWDLSRDLAESTWKLLQKEVVAIGEISITTLAVLRFIFIIFATIWIARLTTRALSAVIRRRKGVKKSLVYTISRLINYLLLAIGFLVALSSLGFDFSNLILIMSALGVGIGFGLQSIFNNFISGIIILFESNLKVGDYVELESGLRGEVREINVRSTLITNNDGIDVLVPNSEIISNKVLNWTLKMPYRRVRIPFSTAYGSDKELIEKVVLEAAKKVPHTLEKIGIPEPRIRMTCLGDNGLEFELVVWIKGEVTKRFIATRSDYLWAIETALRANNITIPFPQRDVHMIKNKKNDNFTDSEDNSI